MLVFAFSRMETAQSQVDLIVLLRQSAREQMIIPVAFMRLVPLRSGRKWKSRRIPTQDTWGTIISAIPKPWKPYQNASFGTTK